MNIKGTILNRPSCQPKMASTVALKTEDRRLTLGRRLILIRSQITTDRDGLPNAV